MNLLIPMGGDGMKSILSRNINHQILSPHDVYFVQIKDTPLLSADQEKQLAYEIAQGSFAARDQMVRANLRLVVNIARGFTGRGLPLLDLIEEGNLGLLRAVEGFDPSMNTRFSTYAGYWIKQSMKRALVNSGKTIRIPSYMVELISKWRRASHQLQEELGRLPSVVEIGRFLGLPKKKIKMIQKAIQVSSSTGQNDYLEEWSIDETIPDSKGLSPDGDLLHKEQTQKLRFHLESMDPRDAIVIRMRFGLGSKPKTLKEIGEELGLTRERIRQIETQALKYLKSCLDHF